MREQHVTASLNRISSGSGPVSLPVVLLHRIWHNGERETPQISTTSNAHLDHWRLDTDGRSGSRLVPSFPECIAVNRLKSSVLPDQSQP